MHITRRKQEILQHIDLVARSSRILAGPDTWKVKPRKKGFTAPLLVNIFAVAILAAGLFGLWRMFDASESTENIPASAISTAEGRLLQEIRREAEGRIQDKDREITAIQQKMAALDREKNQLLTSVEDRIRAKEAELRRILEEELERERQRLLAAGLTPATIQDRLRAFEKEKTEAMKRELDAFARKADEEMRAIQANLDRARAEYQQSLQSVTTERQRILDESRRREQELRSQLDEKNRALEEERARTTARLRDTQEELARLNEEAARAQAAEDRLLGLYASARAALREGRIDDATRNSEALRTYMDDPSLAALPGLNRRRESDLFTVDLVEQAVAAARSRTSVDTPRITDALDAVTRIRQEASLAKSARESGDGERAEAAYRRMFTALPELAEGQAFLERQSAESISGARVVQDAAVLSAYEALDSAYEARDWAGVDTAFRDLLTSLSLEDSQGASVLRRIKESGAAAASASRRVSDTVSAAAPLRSAESDRAAGRLADAILGYSAVLSRFPDADQRPQALEGLRQATRRLSGDFEEYKTATQTRIAALEARLAASEDTAALRQDRSVRPAPSGSGSADAAALLEEKARLEAELAESERRYANIRRAYESFSADERRIRTSGGTAAQVSGRSRLDTFFLDPAVAAAMPGMRERVAYYLSAYQAAGEKEVLYNAADIVEGAARIRDPGTREKYFREMEARYKGNATMLEFLKTIRGVMK